MIKLLEKKTGIRELNALSYTLKKEDEKSYERNRIWFYWVT